MFKELLIVSDDYGSISSARFILANANIRCTMGQGSNGETYLISESLGLLKYNLILNKLQKEVERGARFDIIIMS